MTDVVELQLGRC